MKNLLAKGLVLFVLYGCSSSPPEVAVWRWEMRGVDLSSLPEYLAHQVDFYNSDGAIVDPLVFLKDAGVNTVRVRIWNDSRHPYSSPEKVTPFLVRLRSLGFKTWVDFHYSDTWADPGQQRLPEEWAALSLEQLEKAVEEFTEEWVRLWQPDFVQTGNEINNGFLWPLGKRENTTGWKRLLEAAIRGCRKGNPETQIILHYAGVEGALDFFKEIKDLDFDIVALSYYPHWHGKSLQLLRAVLDELAGMTKKGALIAETAYPFTLAWNDTTHNILGSEESLLPAFSATPQGQAGFIRDIRSLVRTMPQGLGFCYWGGELVARDKIEEAPGSPWENQALFDFQNRALPVLREFHP